MGDELDFQTGPRRGEREEKEEERKEERKRERLAMVHGGSNHAFGHETRW
jgi:hypothetical protein